MGFTYTVVEQREENLDVTGDKNTLKMTWTKSYAVEVAATAPDTIAGASIVDVSNADGIPLVNQSTYDTGTKIIPYLVCRSKTVKRDPKRLARYEVTTKWNTNPAEDVSESNYTETAYPANIDAIPPRVEIELGETEWVTYKDKSATPKDCLTPTGNYFDEPFVERIPVKTLKITQYETYIDFDDMLDRKFKVNETTYRGGARYTWMIEQVEAHEAQVTLAGPVVTNCAIVTYTVSFSPLPNGWKEDRALIDTHYFEGTPAVKKAFRDDEARTLTVGFIESDGTEKVAATVPDYDQWEMQDTIDFSTFLRA